MEFTGRLLNINRDWNTGQYQATFSINEQSALQYAEEIRGCGKLSVEAKKYREKRSLDANACLWLCLGRIAEVLRADKWDIYLQMLKRYGKYTYICVKPNVVEAVKKQWRECEVIGEMTVNGQEAVQMLCYFGSSTYTTQEFSVLLDGVISEMNEMKLETPLPQDIRKALEVWEKQRKNQQSVLA